MQTEMSGSSSEVLITAVHEEKKKTKWDGVGFFWIPATIML